MMLFDHVRHLARRWRGALSTAPPNEEATRWAHSHLLPAEAWLWDEMCVQDRRHSVVVARRFADSSENAGPEQIAGALLHDVGKIEADLGTFGRVLATIVGPRGTRFTRYHDHERLGSQLADRAGSEDATIELIAGRGPAADALRRCDNV